VGESRWRCVPRRFAAAALALALHGAVLPILIALPVRRTAPAFPRTVSVAIVLTAGVQLLRSRHRHTPAVTGARAGHEPTKPMRARAERAPAPARNVRSVRPAVGWLSALRRVARQMTSGRAPPPVRFGLRCCGVFAPGRRPQPWDGWDYAATHRIEQLPQGGTVIALDERCSLVIAPMPIVGCWLGRIAASGHLFRHMRPRPVGSLP
jgi:hypothetical protein